MSRETSTAELTYAVPGVSCSHCQSAIDEEVRQVPGVTGAVSYTHLTLPTNREV